MVAGADRMAADTEHQRLPLSPVPMIQREDDRPRPCLRLLGMVLRCSILAAVVAAAVDAVYKREKLYRRSTYAFAFDDPDTRKYARYLARDSGSAPANFSAAAWAAAYGAAASAVRRCDTQEMTALYVGRKASACGNGANPACERGFGLSAAGAFAACDGGHFCAEDAVCAVACPTGAACPPSVAQDGACAFPSELEKTTSPTNGLCPGSSAVHPCPSGFSCPDATTRLPCPAHHFCPKGSARPKRCSAFARCASERASRQDFSGASQRLALASLVLVVVVVRVSRLLQSFLAFLRRHRSRKRRAFRAAPVAGLHAFHYADDGLVLDVALLLVIGVALRLGALGALLGLHRERRDRASLPKALCLAGVVAPLARAVDALGRTPALALAVFGVFCMVAAGIVVSSAWW